MTTWRCFCCDEVGAETEGLDALIAFQRHYLARHYQRGEAA